MHRLLYQSVMPRNYIPDQNRFSLAGPPAWWLDQLWDFDDSLVVIPSRQDCLYRLAQRRPLQLPEHIVNDALFQQSDTQMLASYGLVPVTSIRATANWSNPLLFKELAERAPHRLGGADKVNKLIEDREAELDRKRRADRDDMLVERAKAGWQHYQYRTGARAALQPNGQTASVSAPDRTQRPRNEANADRLIVPAS